jgi:hypothetical protein
MTNNSQAVLAAVFLSCLAGASTASAQRVAAATGSTVAVSRSAHVEPVAARAVSTRVSARSRIFPVSRRGMHFNPVTHSFVSADGSFVPLQDVLNLSSNFGLGFGPGAVLNQDLGIKAVIDPVTEWKLAIAERFLRNTPLFAGTGFYLLDGGGAYSVPDDSAPTDTTSGDSTQSDRPAQQPQVIVLQQASPSQQTDQQPVADQSEQPTDVGQFVLVLQNGTQIQAIAFTRMKDRLVYITADGNRRSLAIADLNSEATVQINEERGTPLQFPL